VQKVKQEIELQIELSIQESEFAQKTLLLDKNMNDHTQKLELNNNRARDENSWIKEQLQKIQTDRKQDINDTADLIKQLVQ
jgi:hypothetical protein